MIGLVLLTVFGHRLECQASDDWPMWRYDAQRTSSSPNQPPTKPELLWKQSYGARVTAWDDPLNQDLMPYDRIFEPIVVGGKVLLGFNDQDKLVALDAATGKTCWTFFAEAPIRFAPAAWRNRIFVCSDDGYLYCLRAETGELLWKFSGAPNAQHALGNRRLTSAWPARGAPAVREDKVYFAASIWPFMGTFIYALDCETGKLSWINDSTGSQYIKQPHSAPSFAGVGPQGCLVATDKFLIVPGGRSVPAVLDRADGKFRHFEINAGGKGTGGSFVAADEKQFFVHTRLNGTRAFHIESGKKTAFMPCEPVIRGEFLYAAAELNGQRLINCYLANQEADENREPEWSFDANASDDLIAAGDHLVASGAGKVSIIKLPSLVDGDWKGMKILHEIAIAQPVKRVLVADRKVLCVTEVGDIYCYGDSNVTDRSADQKTNATDGSTDQHSSSTASSSAQAVKISDQSLRSAEKRLADWLRSGQAEGYAFWFGPCNPPMIEALAKATPFVQLAIVDSDSARVHQTRQQLDRLGVYGRITVHQAKPRDFRTPQNVAHMVFVSKPNETATTDEDWQAIYSAVRPFGGTVIVSAAENSRVKLQEKLSGLKLEQADVQSSPTGLIIKRNGPLAGADDWTHQYGSIANTLKSNDSRVKLPLGILWFGGSSNMDVLPRHGHGPPQQVLGGRLYIEGMNSLSARDVYSGRVLWQREFENLGTQDVYFDDTYDNKPLDPKYNQVHIPGANARGTNYVVTEDRVYLVVDNHCKILDAVTGRDLGKIELPTTKSGDPEWGFIGVYKDVLLGGVGFANYRNRNSLEFETDSLLALTKIGFGSKSLDRAASRALIAFDRKTGEQLWRVDANHSFWHNGIVAGGDRIYMLDRNPAIVEDAMKRRGIAKNDSYRIIAVDYKTGQTLWEAKENITGTWLGYSEKHDLLLHARSAATDRLADESGRGMRVYNAKDGSVHWAKDKLSYSGPCIIHNNWIITNANAYAQSAGAFDIRTGEQRMTKNPLTGKFQPWKITRAYGCNNIIASENMLTFRSGAAGYYDLLTESGTGNLGGFKSGCTSNLVVAGGVLNAPDYTRTCSCAYQNQTSLALVHMPGLDTWATNFTAVSVPENEIIQDLAINIGAPGDRRDSSGTLWLDFPAVGGDSPALALTLDKDAKYFQQQTSTFGSSNLPWVFASGAYNLRELRLILRTQKRPEAPPKSADDEDEKTAATTAASAANSNSSESKTAPTSTTTTANASSSGTTATTTSSTPPVIEVLRDPIPPTMYRLELYFSLPNALENQHHRFEVKVKDQVQVVELSPQTQKADDDEQVYHSITFDSVVLDGELVVEFDAKLGSTVLSGFRLTKSQKK
ncbi:MAG: PQQ-binding-like beta-propeller repeat protein [Pirellulales bacterium]